MNIVIDNDALMTLLSFVVGCLFGRLLWFGGEVLIDWMRRRRRRRRPVTFRASNIDSLAHLYKRYYGTERMQQYLRHPPLTLASLTKWRPPHPINHDPGDEDRS